MKNHIKMWTVVAIIAVILEVFVFNMKFWTTYGYTPTELQVSNVGQGLAKYDDGSYLYNGSENSYFEIKHINKEIKNIYIDIGHNAKKNGYRQFITIYATDEGNKLYYKLPQRVYVSDVEASRYISMETSGISEKIRIYLSKGAYKNKVWINKIEINRPVPFCFNFIRFFIIVGVISVIYMLRYKTEFFKGSLNFRGNNKKAAVIAVVMINVLFAVFIYNNNLFYEKLDRRVYSNLADSLIQGRFDLPMLEVSDKLAEMENPYDRNYRHSILNVATENMIAGKEQFNKDDYFFWDYAFKDGKYYVYFGVVPCVLLFVPYRLITGDYLPVNLAMLIYSIVFILVCFRFVYSFLKRFFAKTPFTMYILMAQLLCFGAVMVPFYLRNDLYGIPNLSGLIFTFAGLDLWINCFKDNNKVKNAVKLGMGALCMALVAGCRPQMLIACFFAVPLFWENVFKNKKLFYKSREGIINTIAFVSPFVITAAFLMYYNYARFGSVTDFGAMYNLTTNDMTKRGFRLSRLPYGLFAYFFQLPEIRSALFPFIKICSVPTQYMGVTISERMAGGVFMLIPVLWLNFLVCFKEVRKMLKEKNMLIPLAMAQVMAFIIVCADINMAGVVHRYISDFTWLILLGAYVIFLIIDEKLGERGKHILRFSFSVMFLVSMVINMLASFVPYSNYSMETSNPNVFYDILFSIEFWL